MHYEKNTPDRARLCDFDTKQLRSDTDQNGAASAEKLHKMFQAERDPCRLKKPGFRLKMNKGRTPGYVHSYPGVLSLYY